MVRISKQAERRSRYPRKHRKPQDKPEVKNIPQGFKEHVNALPKEAAEQMFVPKIK